VIRIVCPHCASEILLLMPTEEDGPVVCPRCGRAFVPDEEQWVDPEDV
jgi:DNA-directed RNA polymerase subunit RPC12/RpoP